MNRRLLSRLFVALALAGASTAVAKDKPHVYPRPPAEGSSSSSSSRNLEKVDVSRIKVEAVAGAADITGGVGSSFNTGPVLGVRAGAEAGRLFELEAGYQASRHGIDDAAVGDNQALYRHNVDLFGKVGPELSSFRPFVGAGVGASYANVTDAAEDNSIYRNDFFAELPLGAGLEFEGKSFTAGVRATWTSLFFDEFAEPTPSADNPSSSLVTGLVEVGGSF